MEATNKFITTNNLTTRESGENTKEVNDKIVDKINNKIRDIKKLLNLDSIQIELIKEFDNTDESLYTIDFEYGNVIDIYYSPFFSSKDFAKVQIILNHIK